MTMHTRFRPLALAMSSALLLGFSTLAAAQEAPRGPAAAPAVTPRAQAVLDRMTTYLRSLQAFSISADSSRDEVLAEGYKLQHNEHSELTVQRPNKLRAELQGDLRTRTIVYDGEKLSMYSPDDAAYVRVATVSNLADLIGSLLDAGVEMPMIDVLYQGAVGNLTQNVSGGAVVGESVIDGVACDHLAFRQSNVDWQLWVQKGEQALPRKIVITTRFEVGDPQYQVTMHWNLKPKVSDATFKFTAPANASEVSLMAGDTSK